MKTSRLNLRTARSIPMRNPRSPHRWVGTLMALLGLVSWMILPGYASNRLALSGPTKKADPTIRSGNFSSGSGSIRSASGQMPSPSINVWTSNGPEGAQILSLAVDPVNPSVIYAGSDYGKVFKSTNSGTTWSAINVGSSVYALALDPGNPAIIYAADAIGDSCEGGVLKSTDGGASWSITGFRAGGFCNAWRLATTPNGTLYAIGDDGIGNGIYKSSDGGAIWTVVRIVNPNGSPAYLNAYSVTIDPGNPNAVYVGYDGACTPPGCFGGGQPPFGLGLYKTNDDGGGSWTATRTALPDAINTLAIDPTSAATLYAGTLGSGVFKSVDGGGSWGTINNGLPSNAGISALLIDPANTKTIYAGTQNYRSRSGGAVFAADGVFKSTDAGLSWSEIKIGLTDLDINALTIDSTGTFLHAGTGAGVFDLQSVAACADSLSPTTQNFEASGGNSSVDVTAGGECSWTTTSGATWITLTSGSSAITGNGRVSYSVEPNTGTLPRAGTLVIAARAFTITQAGLPVRITSASVRARKLFVYGENFDAGAVILLNGEEQKTINNSQPGETLTGKRAGEKIKPGDKLRVRNPNGTLSEKFTFAG
jgi:Viral BACON domain